LEIENVEVKPMVFWIASARLLVIAGGIHVILRHRANIQRLLAGTEPPLGRGGSDPTAETQS
jgi:glycerol-3-phosphate acyltransferase PlsY